MKKRYLILLTLLFILQSCSSVKVQDAWRGADENIDKFKEKNVLVFARSANNTARIAFEEQMAIALRNEGIEATESFKKFP